MKYLLLLRHGKSEWHQQGREDIERTLTDEGRQEAAGIARWLVANALQPNHMLVSTAVRTRQTCELMCGGLERAPLISVQDELYLAAPGTLLAHIEALPDTTDIAMVVGHNPGLEELARMLAGPDPDGDSMRGLMLGIPTAGLAVMALAGNDWSRLSVDGSRLEAFIRPGEFD